MPKRSIITKKDGVPIAQTDVATAPSKALAPVPKPIEGEVVNAPLTPEELKEHTARIERILAGFRDIANKSLEIWHDLKWIKDNRTYRDKYDTFNEFCRDELGKDNSQIYRYIRDAEFKEALLLEAGDDAERSSIMGLKESNTRFIRTLPDDIQKPFWKLVYGVGVNVLSKKEDGSIEPTTAFMESVGESVNDITKHGGINLDGKFVPLTKMERAAEIANIDETKAKALFLAAGVSEEYYEALQRQGQHIREKSMKADITQLRGTIDTKTDVNGSDYPVLVDPKGNEHDLTELLLSFNNRFIHLSIKSPIRE